MSTLYKNGKLRLKYYNSSSSSSSNNNNNNNNNNTINVLVIECLTTVVIKPLEGKDCTNWKYKVVQI